MKSIRGWNLVLLAVSLLATAALPVRPAAAQLPVLEKYTLETLGERRGTLYELHDASLGGGDAQSRLRLRRAGDTLTLSLRVWRVVPPGRISFALLGELVEVRGYSFEGSLVYSRDFAGLEEEGVYFGDSRSGDWRRTLRDLPLTVKRLEVTYFGNYE